VSDGLMTRIEGTGTAKSFNALAAASTALASDGRIKDVIFSAITVNKDATVSFSVSATLDPKIVSNHE
jgi:Tfp pilus assembly protein PilN